MSHDSDMCNLSLYHILIVDDAKVNNLLLADMLGAMGFSVSSALSGEEAFEKIALRLPDLILLDIQLPGINGYEICAALKAAASTADTPVIFLTAMTQPEDVVRGFEAGGVDYISKPFIAAELTARVKTHLYLKKIRQELQNEIEERRAAEEKLEQRNRIMESELDMARDIQLRLLPHRTPNESVSAFYKPMDKVGGDFYDFVVFRDSDMFGVFISDVSGHGVPAAFITSMVKSLIRHDRERLKDPASLLASINHFLINKTNGNFVTALYGLYDPESRMFTYCNAGHSRPYLITQGKAVKIISQHKGVPLAIYDTDELTQKNLVYQNQTIELAPGNKLFLYTDGLTEAIPAHVSCPPVDDFETKHLLNVFEEVSEMNSMDVLKHIVSRLVDFRGSESFDDDVCMICLDA